MTLRLIPLKKNLQYLYFGKKEQDSKLLQILTVEGRSFKKLYFIASRKKD